MAKKPAKKKTTETVNKKRPANGDGKFKKGNKFAVKKGEVRNPGGRPKGPDMRKLLTEFMQEEVEVGKQKEKKKRIRVLLEAMFKHAVSGNVGYMTHILERMFGKVKQEVEIMESQTYIRQSEPERINGRDSDTDSEE